MLSQIARLKRMPVAELRVEWQRLYGEPTRSRNRDYLWRRLAWRTQELVLGGLDPATKARLDQLADEYPTFVRARRPSTFNPDALVAPAPTPPTTTRDPRLPSVGTNITRTWRGKDLRLLVRDQCFELDGVVYASLSEAARGATGSRWSGWLFWGLKPRMRKR